MSFNAETFFLFQPFKTDELKASLETLREELRGKDDRHKKLLLQMGDVSNQLEKMEEKAVYVSYQVSQISALLMPPASQAEKFSDDKDKYVSNPAVIVGGALVSAGVLQFMVGSVLAPGVMKLVKGAPKVAKGAKIAKASKFLKVSKFAKVTVVLGIAVGILDMAFSFATASQINALLRKDQKALTDAINEADDLLDEMSDDLKKGRGMVADLLREAGFGNLPIEEAMAAYINNMNEAIAGLGKQKAVARMVRRMSMLGLDRDAIAATAEIDAALVDELLKSLALEKAIAAGEDAAAVAQQFGVQATQVNAIKSLVDARGALVAGDDPKDVAKRFDLPLAVITGEVEENIRRAAPHWEKIETGEDLTAVARALLVAQPVLERLHVELATKAALAEGGDVSNLADARGLRLETVEAWHTDLVEARGQIEQIAQEGTTTKPTELAASYRLPLDLAA